MEIFNFYQMSNIFFHIFTRGKNEVLAVTWGLAFGVILWAVMFILQGVGLYKMARHCNLKHRWLAFVPFANICYMGKLAGECTFFGHKMKNAGLYAMLSQIVATALACMYIFSEWYLYTNHGAPQQTTDALTALPLWTGLTGFSLTVAKLSDISAQLLTIFSLVAQLLMLVLVMGLYKKYEPKNYMTISMLTLFIPVARFVTVFVLRNNKAVDYEAYMRARREEYFRRQQQYRGNPYNGNPYGQNQNPYGQNPYGQNPYSQNSYGQPPKQEDPFAEFASSNAKDTSSTKEDDSDGFFN